MCMYDAHNNYAPIAESYVKCTILMRYATCRAPRHMLDHDGSFRMYVGTNKESSIALLTVASRLVSTSALLKVVTHGVEVCLRHFGAVPQNNANIVYMKFSFFAKEIISLNTLGNVFLVLNYSVSLSPNFRTR